MQIRWNQNGNWLLTASRDHLLKLFDIRAMKEIQTFRGHKREATGENGFNLENGLISLLKLYQQLAFKLYFNPSIYMPESLHSFFLFDNPIVLLMSLSHTDKLVVVVVILAISWHPIHESLFVSGGSDGSMMFWVAG